jgi:hypothetical protein
VTKHTRAWILVVVLANLPSSAVPLQNWRFPFYRIAAERDEIRSSPSGLFWDDLEGCATFDSLLWPDSASYASNHWTLEPALGLSGANDAFSSGKKTNLHFDLLSDIRYGGLTVRNVLDVDQRYKTDTGYVWHKERVAAGRIEEAYAKYAGRHWFARLGRMNRCWGPFPDRSVLLSDNPYSYDAFEWQVTASFFEFRHMIAAFPKHGSHIDTHSATEDINRYFVAHSLNFMVGSWASLGISETVVFSRTRGLPDLQYLNPFSIYAVINTNQEAASWREGSGNLMLGVQGWVHPFTKKIILRGQVALDDFQVDSESPIDREPAHWAVDLGAVWKEPLVLPLKHHIGIDYRYLSKWVYTVRPDDVTKGERYTYLGRSLGYQPIDGDEFRAAATLTESIRSGPSTRRREPSATSTRSR